MNSAPETARLAEDGTSGLVNTLAGYGLREGMGESIEVLRRPSNVLAISQLHDPTSFDTLDPEDRAMFMEADGVVSK